MGTVSQLNSKKQYDDDIIDTLINEWNEELPLIDVEAFEIIGRVQYLGSHYEGDANKALKPLDIKYTDFDVLGTLRRRGAPYQLTPTQLCNSVLITSGAMTAALDRLEDAGYIKRVLGSSDRRARLAQLTQRGLKISEKAAKIRFETARLAIDGLDENEKTILASLLRKLVKQVGE